MLFTDNFFLFFFHKRLEAWISQFSPWQTIGYFQLLVTALSKIDCCIQSPRVSLLLFLSISKNTERARILYNAVFWPSAEAFFSVISYFVRYLFFINLQLWHILFMHRLFVSTFIVFIYLFYYFLIRRIDFLCHRINQFDFLGVINLNYFSQFIFADIHRHFILTRIITKSPFLSRFFKLAIKFPNRKFEKCYYKNYWNNKQCAAFCTKDRVALATSQKLQPRQDRSQRKDVYGVLVGRVTLCIARIFPILLYHL